MVKFKLMAEIRRFLSVYKREFTSIGQSKFPPAVNEVKRLRDSVSYIGVVFQI